MILRSVRRARLLAAVGGIGMVIGGAADSASAQSVPVTDVQGLIINTVCNKPTGGLFLDRCLETRNPPVGDPATFATITTNSNSSLNPNQVAVAAGNALASAQALAVTTEKRLEGLRDEGNGKPGADDGKIAGFGPWSIFANVQGEWFDQRRPANSNERGFDGDRYRGTLGFDYRLNAGSRLGVMFSYEKYTSLFDAEISTASFVPPSNAGSAEAKTFAATAFASFAPAENVWIDAAAGIAWSNNDFRRNAIFQPAVAPMKMVPVNTSGSADGRQYFASFGAGYDFTSGSLSIGPYVRGRYTHSKIDGYRETDLSLSGLAMDVGQQKATSFAGVLGIRSSFAISASWGVIVPQVRFEYEHEFKDDIRTTETQFVLDPNPNQTGHQLPVTTDAPDREYANAGFGLAFVLPRGIVPFIDYEALIGYKNFTRHRVTAGLRVEF